MEDEDWDTLKAKYSGAQSTVMHLECYHKNMAAEPLPRRKNKPSIGTISDEQSSLEQKAHNGYALFRNRGAEPRRKLLEVIMAHTNMENDRVNKPVDQANLTADPSTLANMNIDSLNATYAEDGDHNTVDEDAMGDSAGVDRDVHLAQEAIQKLLMTSQPKFERAAESARVLNRLLHLEEGEVYSIVYKKSGTGSGKEGKKLEMHQITGFHFMLKRDRHIRGGMIADRMGMGKSQLMSAYVVVTRRFWKIWGKPLTAPILVLCPNMLLEKTSADFIKFLGGDAEYQVLRYKA